MENSLIYRNLESVKKKIKESAERVNRSSEEVKLVSVTKTQSVEKIEEIFHAGSFIIGENRVQEARDKRLEMDSNVADGLEWRLIGKLQKNKVKIVLGLFDIIESVDSLSLAKEISRFAEKITRKPFNIYIQVNTGDEVQKNGIKIDETEEFVRWCKEDKHLNIVGLMSIPPINETSSVHFNILKNLSNKCGLDEVSMGMTSDYKEAIQFGSTFLRIGSGIFGKRT